MDESAGPNLIKERPYLFRRFHVSSMIYRTSKLIVFGVSTHDVYGGPCFFFKESFHNVATDKPAASNNRNIPLSHGNAKSQRAVNGLCGIDFAPTDVVQRFVEACTLEIDDEMIGILIECSAMHAAVLGTGLRADVGTFGPISLLALSVKHSLESCIPFACHP